MKKQLLAISTLATLAFGGLLNIHAAHASGSMSGVSGATKDSYAVGKSIFFKEVTCQSCPYAGRSKDATDAKALRDLLNSPESKVKLDADSKDALNEYINTRFKLSANKK